MQIKKVVLLAGLIFNQYADVSAQNKTAPENKMMTDVEKKQQVDDQNRCMCAMIGGACFCACFSAALSVACCEASKKYGDQVCSNFNSSVIMSYRPRYESQAWMKDRDHHVTLLPGTCIEYNNGITDLCVTTTQPYLHNSCWYRRCADDNLLLEINSCNDTLCISRQALSSFQKLRNKEKKDKDL